MKVKRRASEEDDVQSTHSNTSALGYANNRKLTDHVTRSSCTQPFASRRRCFQCLIEDFGMHALTACIVKVHKCNCYRDAICPRAIGQSLPTAPLGGNNNRTNITSLKYSSTSHILKLVPVLLPQCWSLQNVLEQQAFIVGQLTSRPRLCVYAQPTQSSVLSRQALLHCPSCERSGTPRIHIENRG